MTVRIALLAAAAFVFPATPQLIAQESEVPTIATDRPSVSTPPEVVPPYSILMNNSLNFEYSRTSYAMDLPENSLRMGIGLRTEVRLAASNLTHSSDSTGSFLQPQDVLFGWKTSLAKDNHLLPQAILVAFSYPTGSEEQTSGSFDQESILIWQQNLSRGLVLVENVGAVRTTVDGVRVTNWMPQLYVSRAICGRAGTFLEYAPTVFSGGGLLHVVDGGFTWTPTPTRQFDVRAGLQNDTAGRHNILSFGYSLRVDRITHRVEHHIK